MQTWINLPTFIMLGVMVLAAASFVIGAMLWLRRLRGNLATAVAEALNRQIHHGQKVEEALCALQRHQKQMEAHVQTLAGAQARTRADMAVLAQRLEQRDVASDTGGGQSRVLH